MIYICIPTHNEQQTVGVVLWKLRQVFSEYPRDYQLLVGDDASTDKTADVLEPYTRVLPLTVIRSGQRQGYGATLEMLLREAVRRSEYPKRDVVVTLQADFSEEPEDLVPLLKRVEAGADLAVGNKVAKARPPRMRRFSRALASFFLRSVKWPEGVATPFEGYRAYRLYAVKRAIEERSGKRLIRYNGWAAQAELLRAVLPHARRVDVVDVVDRTDRLQRPRREQPLAFAMQVRALAGGREPQGLAGVEELDRIAATASRTRERGTIASMSEYAQRAPASNGGRSRQRRPEGRGRDSLPKTGGSSVGQRRGEAQKRGGDEGRKRSSGGEQKRQRGAARTAAENRRPRGEAARARVVEAPETEPQVIGAEGAEQVARPKKRRRRRRKSSGAGETQTPPNTDATVEAAAAADDGADAAADASAGGGTQSGEKKRRRRGGRRGGRGRRRGPKAEGAAEDTNAAAPTPVEQTQVQSEND